MAIPWLERDYTSGKGDGDNRRRTAYLVGAHVADSFVVELVDLSFLC